MRILFLFFALSLFLLFSQNKAFSSERIKDSSEYYKLQILSTELSEVYIACEYLSDYYRNSDHEFAILYALKMIETGRMISEEKEAFSLLFIGDLYAFLGRSHEALEYYQKALLQYGAMEDLLNQAVVMEQIAEVYFNRGLYVQALYRQNEALAFYTYLGMEERSAALQRRISQTAIRVGNNKLAISSLRQSLNFYKQNFKARGLAYTIKFLTRAYSLMDSVAEIDDVFDDFYCHLHPDSPPEHKYLYYDALGNYFINHKEYDSALLAFRKVVALNPDISAKEKGVLYTFLAHVHSLKNQWDSTVFYNKIALEFRRRAGIPCFLTSSWNNLAHDYMKLGKWPEVRMALDSAWFSENRSESRFRDQLYEKEIAYYRVLQNQDSVDFYTNELIQILKRRVIEDKQFDSDLILKEMNMRNAYEKFMSKGYFQNRSVLATIILAGFVLFFILAILLFYRLRKTNLRLLEAGEKLSKALTEEKRSLARLVNSNNKLEYALNILSTANIGILIISPYFEIKYLNDKVVKLFGRNYREIIENDFLRFISEKDQSNIRYHIERSGRNEQTKSQINFCLQNSKSDACKLNMIISPQFNKTNKPVAYTLVLYENKFFDFVLSSISHARKLEQVKAKNNRAFINMISIAISRRLSEIKMVDKVQDLALFEKKLANNLDQINFYNEVVYNDYNIDKQVYLCSDLLKDIAGYFVGEHFLQEEDRRKLENPSSAEEVYIKTNSSLLKRLLKLAWRYMEAELDEGEISISSSLENKGLKIVLEKKLLILQNSTDFQDESARFFDDRHPVLTAIHKTVDLLGGNLNVRRKKNASYTFVLVLPTSDRKLMPSKSLVNRDIYPDLHGKRVLIVEDVYENYLLLKTHLLKSNMYIDLAEDGMKAIELLTTEQRYDIVLMDIQMPKLNGLDTIVVMRMLGFNMPVIAVTAYANNDESNYIRSAGFDAYLSKPIDYKFFLKEIERLLKSNKE